MHIQKNRYQLVVIFLITLITCGSVSAHNNVVVIPMAGDAEPLKNIITVSERNGDFTNLLDAMNSISNASNTNPYLIVLGPGQHFIVGQLIMKDFVSITGSGIDTTEIRGAVGGNGFTETAALIVGGRETEISDLSIVNSVSNEVVIGIHSSQENMRLTRTRVTVFGALGSQYGIVNQESEFRLVDSEVFNSGSTGGSCYGIYSYSNAVLRVNNMNISVNCNDGTQYGVFVNASAVSYINNTLIEIDISDVGYGYFSNGNNSKGYISDSIIGGADIAVYGGTSAGIFYKTYISNSDLRSNGSGNVECDFTRLHTGFPLPDDDCAAFN